MPVSAPNAIPVVPVPFSFAASIKLVYTQSDDSLDSAAKLLLDCNVLCVFPPLLPMSMLPGNSVVIVASVPTPSSITPPPGVSI